MTGTIDLVQGRLLASKATKGPWIQREFVPGLIRIEQAGHLDALLYRDPIADPETSGDIRLTVDDAEFIVWVRNNIITLLDEATQGRELREQATTQMTGILQQLGEIGQAAQKFDQVVEQLDTLCNSNERIQRELGSTNPVLPISVIRDVLKGLTE